METAHNKENLSQIIASAEGMELVDSITGGHRGAVINRCVDDRGREWVLKYGLSEIAKQEVQNNAYGYEQITLCGGENLIPNPIKYGIYTEIPYLILPYLGGSITDTSDDFQDLDIHNLLRNFSQISETTIRNDDPYSQKKSLEHIIDILTNNLSILKENGFLKQESVDALIYIDCSKFSTKMSNLFIMDFTSDNVFMNSGQVKFIDPWKQITYRGTFLISLSQFFTLGTEVYQLPTFKENNEAFGDTMLTIAKQLNLNSKQTNAQLLLGRVLQLSLSSIVRINPDPRTSQKYADLCKIGIDEILSL